MDYRDALRAKGFKPMTPAKVATLRTRRQAGHVEPTPGGLLRYADGERVELVG